MWMNIQNCIDNHLRKINQIEQQINKLQENYEKTKNLFLPEEINLRILNHEKLQLENEITIHNLCIDCLKSRKHIDLVADYKLTNARKKKLNKLFKNKINFEIE